MAAAAETSANESPAGSAPAEGVEGAALVESAAEMPGAVSHAVEVSTATGEAATVTAVETMEQVGTAATAVSPAVVVASTAHALADTAEATSDILAQTVPVSPPVLPPAPLVMPEAAQTLVATSRLQAETLGTAVVNYFIAEGEAFAAHMRALAGARSMAEIVRLQIGEFQRAADATLSCWGLLTIAAGRTASAR